MPRKQLLREVAVPKGEIGPHIHEIAMPNLNIEDMFSLEDENGAEFHRKLHERTQELNEVLNAPQKQQYAAQVRFSERVTYPEEDDEIFQAHYAGQPQMFYCKEVDGSSTGNFVCVQDVIAPSRGKRRNIGCCSREICRRGDQSDDDSRELKEVERMVERP